MALCALYEKHEGKLGNFGDNYKLKQVVLSGIFFFYNLIFCLFPNKISEKEERC